MSTLPTLEGQRGLFHDCWGDKLNTSNLQVNPGAREDSESTNEVGIDL